MPIDPISLSMMVAGIGLQFYTNIANSKKQAQLQEKQQEFKRVQQEKDFKRMRELQEETTRLNAELELELHQQRIEEIQGDYDVIIEDLAKEKSLNSWPISILPFVAKGERFGSYLGGNINAISMQCILTPSNNPQFNRLVYKDIDYQVQAYINDQWHSQSSHPILYHGGGWKDSLSGRNLKNQINNIKSQLSAIPTMVITPYFDEDNSFYFLINIWGMGKSSEIHFSPTSDVFSYDYESGEIPPPNAENDFVNTTIREFVPFIVSLIGVVADKYYWSLYNISPFLPKAITDAVENNYIDYPIPIINSLKSYYSDLICSVGKECISTSKVLSLYCGTSIILNSKEKSECLHKIANFNPLIQYCLSLDSQNLRLSLCTKEELCLMEKIQDDLETDIERKNLSESISILNNALISKANKRNKEYYKEFGGQNQSSPEKMSESSNSFEIKRQKKYNL